MPRLMVLLNDEEFDRLRDRALDELRHPRHTARLLLREALELPPRERRVPIEVAPRRVDAHDQHEAARATA
jgi:hypothetical protein